jgi:hypothetical protein
MSDSDKAIINLQGIPPPKKNKKKITKWVWVFLLLCGIIMMALGINLLKNKLSSTSTGNASQLSPRTPTQRFVG